MRRLLIWATGAAGVLFAAICLACLIGATLPVAHLVSRAETFPLSAPQLWQLALDAFHRSNNGTYAIVEAKPPNRLVTAIVRKDLPFGGSWTYDFVPHGEATTLTITERGEVYNVFFRFVSRFIMGYEGTLRDYFATLRKSVNENRAAATPKGRG